MTLHYLVLTDAREIVQISFEQGSYFLDELGADFGAEFYILETAMTYPDGTAAE